jgi:hypothetical protein
MNQFSGTREERLNELREIMKKKLSKKELMKHTNRELTESEHMGSGFMGKGLMGEPAHWQLGPLAHECDVNNHIHTFYSFSPYSPTEAVWKAYQAGLATAGIMDHDSVAGVCEFIEAGRIAGIATTVGVECRADFSNTLLAGKRINNPDQDSIAYIALHGIPHTQLDTVQDYFKPYREYRNRRNRAMTDKIHSVFSRWGINLDFERDIVPLSKYHEGGSITERHILYGLAQKLIGRFGRGTGLTDFLENEVKIRIPAKLRDYLTDNNNVHYAYDLLGLLKSELLPGFYIDASDECPDIHELVSFGKSVGAIVAYPYLGDVGDSVTGDKRAQKFEDDYLELLFQTLKELGFDAVTYMPSRNSERQLQRIQALCGVNDFFQISGEDINSPRQPFICEAMRDKSFSHLKDAAWALIGHEKSATLDIKKGMFSHDVIRTYPKLRERVDLFQKIGREEVYGEETCSGYAGED